MIKSYSFSIGKPCLNWLGYNVSWWYIAIESPSWGGSWRMRLRLRNREDDNNKSGTLQGEPSGWWKVGKLKDRLLLFPLSLNSQLVRSLLVWFGSVQFSFVSFRSISAFGWNKLAIWLQSLSFSIYVSHQTRLFQYNLTAALLLLLLHVTPYRMIKPTFLKLQNHLYHKCCRLVITFS